MTLVNASKLSATLFNLSLAFILLLKLFRGQIYSVPNFRRVMQNIIKLSYKILGEEIFAWRTSSSPSGGADFV